MLASYQGDVLRCLFDYKPSNNTMTKSTPLVENLDDLKDLSDLSYENHQTISKPFLIPLPEEKYDKSSTKKMLFSNRPKQRFLKRVIHEKSMRNALTKTNNHTSSILPTPTISSSCPASPQKRPSSPCMSIDSGIDMTQDFHLSINDIEKYTKSDEENISTKKQCFKLSSTVDHNFDLKETDDRIRTFEKCSSLSYADQMKNSKSSNLFCISASRKSNSSKDDNNKKSPPGTGDGILLKDQNTKTNNTCSKEEIHESPIETIAGSDDIGINLIQISNKLNRLTDIVLPMKITTITRLLLDNIETSLPILTSANSNFSDDIDRNESETKNPCEKNNSIDVLEIDLSRRSLVKTYELEPLKESCKFCKNNYSMYNLRTRLQCNYCSKVECKQKDSKTQYLNHRSKENSSSIVSKMDKIQMTSKKLKNPGFLQLRCNNNNIKLKQASPHSMNKKKSCHPVLKKYKRLNRCRLIQSKHLKRSLQKESSLNIKRKFSKVSINENISEYSKEPLNNKFFIQPYEIKCGFAVRTTKMIVDDDEDISDDEHSFINKENQEITHPKYSDSSHHYVQYPLLNKKQCITSEISSPIDIILENNDTRKTDQRSKHLAQFSIELLRSTSIGLLKKK